MKKRIIVEVNDLVPLVLIERSRWATDTVGETEGFVVLSWTVLLAAIESLD